MKLERLDEVLQGERRAKTQTRARTASSLLDWNLYQTKEEKAHTDIIST
jgi:hypothetical protein